MSVQERYEAVYKKLKKVEKLRKSITSDIFIDVDSIIIWIKGLEKIENKILDMEILNDRIPLQRLPTIEEVTKVLDLYDLCTDQAKVTLLGVRDFLNILLHNTQSSVCSNCMYSWYDKEGTCKEYCDKYYQRKC